MIRSTQTKTLNSGFETARQITRRYATSFYFASHLLDLPQKRAAYSLYAACRLIDEAVDGQLPGHDIIRLNDLQQKIHSAYNNDRALPDPLWEAFRHTVHTYPVPQMYFDTLVDGMRMDVQKKRYADFDELYAYCYKVAGIVGLMMLAIFGSHNSAEAEKYAVDLGIAMQLTNILRDIKEDWQMGRLYLPQDELSRFNVTENMIVQSDPGKPFQALMRFQIDRARHYFNESEKGIHLINGAGARLVVSAMKAFYAGILTEIEANNYDVFQKRAYVSVFGKIALLSKTLLSFPSLNHIRDNARPRHNDR